MGLAQNELHLFSEGAFCFETDFHFAGEVIRVRLTELRGSTLIGKVIAVSKGDLN